MEKNFTSKDKSEKIGGKAIVDSVALSSGEGKRISYRAKAAKAYGAGRKK